MSWGLDFAKGLGEQAGSGLLSGASNALFGGIAARRNWKYKQKEMKLQQQYTLEQMQKQFDYQQQAWNAENEYNDPSAVASRYRSAGVNPLAALGGSGAGIASSMSTPSASGTPSGGSYGSDAAPDYTALTQIKNQNRMADADVKVKEAQARNIDADTRSKENTNSAWDVIYRGLVADTSGKEADARTKQFNSEVARVAADYAEAMAAVDLETRRQGVNRTIQEIINLKKRYDLDDKQIEALDAEIRKANSDIEVNDSVILRNREDANLKSEQAVTEWYKRVIVGTYDAEVQKIDADRDAALARARRADKEIDLLVAKKDLTEEQAKYVRNAVKIAWVNTGINAAKSVSSEIREWVKFVKGSKGSSAASGLITSATGSDIAAAAEDAKIAEMLLAL